MYKIISRAVNNRLKSVVNRFTSRAQKGFTNHRYIQEVLINVCSTINYCNLNNVEGAILSIDQSRAFDTISHKYMTEVYRFFGFGDSFINIMDTIGTNRKAAIIFDDGSISPEFDLETGRPQGDGPSPLQYNMGEEIVLLKIELDPRVRSVFQHNLIPHFAMDLIPDPRRKGVDSKYNVHLSQESNRETDKADGFADDNSTATETTLGSLRTLKEICTEFSTFSGLQSNADKTTLFQVGSVAALSDEILRLGFNTTDSCTLLGMDIDRNLSSLSNYFDTVEVKILRMIEHWDRFKLTLPGRISVCKTFMLSLIGYLGCIITPSDQQLKRLQEITDNYCLGTIQLAKKRRYLPANEGGLGLINIKEFVISLQCSWIKRITQHWGDNWRFDIKAKCYGNVMIANSQTFQARENPILSNICTSFGKFSAEFTNKDDNFKKAYIFRNPFFRRGRNDDRILCERFFGLNVNDHFELRKIAKLKYDDFFVRRAAKSLDEINREFNLNFSLVTYMRLHEALRYAVDRRANVNEAPTQSLEFFLKSFDRGSKPFRRILQHKEKSKWKIENLNTVKTFCEITVVTQPPNDVIRACWGEWNKNYINNRCREFIYKFRNNILGLNARVCKFVQDIEPECSLCRSNKEPRPIHSETFAHVFFECIYTEKYRTTIVNKLVPELLNANVEDRRRFWFFALLPGMVKNNGFVSLIVSLTNLQIWECKLRKECIPAGNLVEDVVFGAKKALKMSMFLRTEKENANFFLCRHISDPP